MAESKQLTIAELKERLKSQEHSKTPTTGTSNTTAPRTLPRPKPRQRVPSDDGKTDKKVPPPIPGRPTESRQKSGDSSIPPGSPGTTIKYALNWENELKRQLAITYAKLKQGDSNSNSSRPSTTKAHLGRSTSTETPSKSTTLPHVKRSGSHDQPPPLPSSPIPGTESTTIKKIILRKADGKLDLTDVDIKALTEARAHPSLQFYEKQLKALEMKQKPPIEDMSEVSLGQPHWDSELRQQLEDAEKEETVEIKTKKKRFSFLFSKKSNDSEDQADEIPPNIGMMDLDECDGNTDLDRLVFHQSLPRLVKVNEDFAISDSVLTLKKGESLMIHMSVPMWRVHAIDADSKEFWMHIHSGLKFDCLPIDPRLDNKTYASTTALAEAKPLPSAVRVTQGHDGGEVSNTVDVDDIIHISHVEMGKDITGKPQKVVIGKCGEQLMQLGEDLDYAEYTTMLSTEFLPMSEIIKLDFPQRVRVVDTEADVRDPKKERHLKLLSFEKEHHVICTQPGNKRVLSIPMTCPVRLTPVSGDWETCRKALPPIYPLLNYTWNVFDLGRPDLPEQYRQIPQPIPAVVHDWMLSYEGKNVSVEVANRYIKGLKNKLEDVKRETRFHRSYLPPPEEASIPLPPRVPGTGEQPPERPPKPKPRKSSPTLQRSVSDSSGFRTARKLLSEESEYDEIEDGYETPIKELKRKLDPLEEATIVELKSLLEKKEEVIRNAKIAEEHQKEKLELLSKENEDLQMKNKTYGSEIRRLQMELDHALARADNTTSDGNVYDSIRPLPAPDGQIYNSPIELQGMKVMSVENVCDMLREINLSQYAESFEKEQIDGNLLETLDDEILKTDIGMSGLHARKLLMAIKKRKI